MYYYTAVKVTEQVQAYQYCIFLKKKISLLLTFIYECKKAKNENKTVNKT